ncbi:transposase [Streptomyces flaveolus]|uniref:transposase n=1 Tax=Streptomyces flaveolus TaxID=67297 RepID=UPI003689EB96
MIDSFHVRAARPGPQADAARSTARPGSKHHVITDGQGIPLAVSLTGGNRSDVTQLLPLLDKIPAVAGVVCRPRRRVSPSTRPEQRCTFFPAPAFLSCSWDSPPLRQEGHMVHQPQVRRLNSRQSPSLVQPSCTGIAPNE